MDDRYVWLGFLSTLPLAIVAVGLLGIKAYECFTSERIKHHRLVRRRRRRDEADDREMNFMDYIA